LNELFTEAVGRNCTESFRNRVLRGIGQRTRCPCGENCRSRPGANLGGAKRFSRNSITRRKPRKVWTSPRHQGIVEFRDPQLTTRCCQDHRDHRPGDRRISIPIYFACQKAREIGLSYIAAGQLSDEMFGGYGKFEDIALRDGIDNLWREMFDSVLAASAKDFDPGDKLAVAAGLELAAPSHTFH